VPDFDSAASPAAILPPLDSVTCTLEREPVLADRPGAPAPGQLDLLEPCDQMSMRFAPELLIP
jgi:hypothetical protein